MTGDAAFEVGVLGVLSLVFVLIMITSAASTF
jgi:hypothetical protein